MIHLPPAASQPTAVACPQFSSLAQKLVQRADGEPIQVSVTSTRDQEGVSTVASQLAVACANLGVPTLLVDANLAAPSQQTRFNLPADDGLAELLSGAASLGCVRSTETANLSVLGAGKDDCRNRTVVSAAALKSLLTGLAQRFSVVIVDAPIASVASGLCAQTHGAILVVQAETVRREVVRKTQAQLEASGANVLGVVLNKRKQHVPNWLYRRL